MRHVFFNWYQKLIGIRKSNELLSTGQIEFYPLTDEILVYKRYDEGRKIFVAVNNQNRKIKFTFNQLSEINDGMRFNEIIRGKQISLSDGYMLEPYSIIIFSEN